MKTTIETINGQQMTVVWHKELKPTWKTEWYKMEGFYALMYVKNTAYHIATALPALPRHPKPEDVWLLYRYMAGGLIAQIEVDGCGGYDVWEWLIKVYANEEPLEITHATNDKTGEEVGIAIEESKDVQ